MDKIIVEKSLELYQLLSDKQLKSYQKELRNFNWKIDDLNNRFNNKKIDFYTLQRRVDGLKGITDYLEIKIKELTISKEEK
tara:strand:+ start:7086 stop:7328 length:243 start_codon:yes stop_codon:yes gene_type:complete